MQFTGISKEHRRNETANATLCVLSKSFILFRPCLEKALEETLSLKQLERDFKIDLRREIGGVKKREGRVLSPFEASFEKSFSKQEAETTCPAFLE